MPISVRRSNLLTLSLMIPPLSSWSASRVPLKSFETHRRKPMSPSPAFLKNGRADSSFMNDTSGPGMPVPPESDPLDPAMSLTIWKNQPMVPNATFSWKFLPMHALCDSGTGAMASLPALSVPTTSRVNCVKIEKSKPPMLK